jgi:hypothetical protein
MVCSHGRPIGVTDLDFFHVKGLARAGWFHPNADGEKMMPLVGSMHRALRAYGSRNRVGEEGASLVHPESIGSQVLADIAEALHRLESLELTLHREDGSLVPTEMIGLQDCEELLAQGSEPETWFEDIDADADDWLDELEQSFEPGPEDFAEFGSPDAGDALLPEIEPVEHPRYQVIVTLVDDDAIP